MDRRQLLTRGAALAAAAPLVPALPALGATAAVAAPGRSAAPADPPSDQLPSRDAIITVLRKVADQWIGSHSDPGDNQWARATFFSGLMALHGLTGDDRYLSYARGWGEKHGYGINGGVNTRHADNHTAGQAYLDLYAIDQDPQQIAGIEASLRHMMSDQPNKNDDWWWDDALHMAMPPYARLGELRDDTAFWDKLYKLYTHTKKAEGGPGLHDAATGLWYRDKNFIPGGIVSPNGKPVFWSRGNGWVAAGHAKILKTLPAGARNVPEYRDTFKKLITALGSRQRSDGFWNVSLADDQHLPGPETSGTSFHTFGTAYAIAAGIVDKGTYLPVAARGWNGMVATAVRDDGFLGYVQKVGDRPESSQPVTADSTADFGVGGFLMAGVELAGLAA